MNDERRVSGSGRSGGALDSPSPTADALLDQHAAEIAALREVLFGAKLHFESGITRNAIEAALATPSPAADALLALLRNIEGIDRVLAGARLPDASLGQDAALVAQMLGRAEDYARANGDRARLGERAMALVKELGCICSINHHPCSKCALLAEWDALKEEK